MTENKPDSNEVKNVNDFSMFIENYCKDNNVTYMDAIIDYCDDNYIDIEDIKPLIHPVIKEKLRTEFINMGMLESFGTLEF
jgi:hypothetical protein